MMNFVWDMTAKNWRNLMKDHKGFDNYDNYSFSNDFEFYGNCYIGHLSADIQHTCDPSDNTSWYAYVNIFGLGIDDGYGETTKGKIPYSLLNYGFKVPMNCKTFKEFKQIFEKNFEEAINSNKELKRLAEMPLGNWE